MKATEFTLEGITRTPSWRNEDNVAPKLTGIPKDAKPFPGYPGLVYHFYKKGSIGFHLGDYTVLHVMDSKKLRRVGKLYFTSANNVIPGAIETSDLFVYEPYKRQGIAANMYRLLAEDMGKIVLADREGGQTPEARKLWLAMSESKIPSLAVKGWVEIDISFYDFAESEEDQIVNIIMKIGGEFLYHNKKKWIVTFNMMPNQAKTELRAAITNQLTRSVYQHEDMMPDFESGLLVISRAKFETMTGYQPQ